MVLRRTLYLVFMMFVIREEMNNLTFSEEVNVSVFINIFYSFWDNTNQKWIYGF